MVKLDPFKLFQSPFFAGGVAGLLAFALFGLNLYACLAAFLVSFAWINSFRNSDLW